MVSKLREKEPFIANAIIRCLRTWRERNLPAPLIVTEEDVEQLAQWAAELDMQWEWVKEFNIKNDFPYKIVPEQIRRHW